MSSYKLRITPHRVSDYTSSFLSFAGHISTVLLLVFFIILGVSIVVSV